MGILIAKGMPVTDHVQEGATRRIGRPYVAKTFCWKVLQCLDR